MSITKTVEEVEEILRSFFLTEDEIEDGEDGWHEWQEAEDYAKKKIWNEVFPDDVKPEYKYFKLTDTSAEYAEYQKSFREWWGRYDAFFKDWEAPLYVAVPDVGDVRVIEQFGGEGDGDRYFIVFEVRVNDSESRYFKIDGWYASHDGGYYDGPFTEVRPIEKVVTLYE